MTGERATGAVHGQAAPLPRHRAEQTQRDGRVRQAERHRAVGADHEIEQMRAPQPRGDEAVVVVSAAASGLQARNAKIPPASLEPRTVPETDLVMVVADVASPTQAAQAVAAGDPQDAFAAFDNFSPHPRQSHGLDEACGDLGRVGSFALSVGDTQHGLARRLPGGGIDRQSCSAVGAGEVAALRRRKPFRTEDLDGDDTSLS